MITFCSFRAVGSLIRFDLLASKFRFCSGIEEEIPLGMVYLCNGSILGYRLAKMCSFLLFFIVFVIFSTFFFETIIFISILISTVMIINIWLSISTAIHVFALW